MRKCLLTLLALAGCGPSAVHTPSPVPSTLAAALEERLAGEPGTIAVAFIDLGNGDTVFRQPDLRYHAASTMKVPVLIQLVRDIDAGRARWSDSIAVVNRFASIVDGSTFTLDRAEDSDSSLYLLEGQRVSQRQLAHLMIARSSNFATNLLIDRLQPGRVQATIRSLGADSVEVRRGVEDGKAFAKGLNNTTTARGLATLLRAIAEGHAASPAGTRDMIDILLGQEFNAGIPAGLPAGVRVAHKTGNITALLHDAAIVYPPRGAPYVLVVLTRGYQDEATAARLIADISRIVYSTAIETRR